MIQLLLNTTDCNQFELDMISNAKIEGILIPNSIELTNNNQYSMTYLEPVGNKSLQELLDEDFFDSSRYHHLLSKIINLKRRLETYMLNSSNLNFDVNKIWYDPIKNAYSFIYLPIERPNPIHELNLYRHIFIESYPKIGNKQLILDLRENCFDLDYFCTSVEKLNTFKKSRRSWFKNLFYKENIQANVESKTIQKTRKSCLLDVQNPTIYYEIHFSHVVIGRSDDCNIQIDDHSISRKHAVICKNKFSFTIEDLYSSNGTFHNGQLLRGIVTLVNGDKLQFGDKEFIFIL